MRDAQPTREEFHMYDIYPQFKLSSIIVGLDFRILFIIYLLNRMLMKHCNSFFILVYTLNYFNTHFLSTFVI